MKKWILYFGTGLFLIATVPSAHAIALYSALTETLYMDCVRAASGDGPVFRLDLQLTKSEAGGAAKAGNSSHQVFIATRLVQLNSDSLCQFGVDPVVQLSDDSLQIHVPQADFISTQGDLWGAFWLDLEVVSGPEIEILGGDVLGEGQVVPEARLRLGIDKFKPDILHGFAVSDLRACLSFFDFSNPVGETIEMLLALSQGSPAPENLISMPRVPVLEGGQTSVSGNTVIDQLGEYNFTPILGEIPTIGWLFKTLRDDADQKNLLVFVTPQNVSCAE